MSGSPDVGEVGQQCLLLDRPPLHHPVMNVRNPIALSGTLHEPFFHLSDGGRGRQHGNGPPRQVVLIALYIPWAEEKFG